MTNEAASIKMKHRLPAYSNTKRAQIYEALKKLEIGKGIEVSGDNKNNYLMACRYAIANFDYFSGWRVSRRKTENGYIIIRTA